MRNKSIELLQPPSTVEVNAIDFLDDLCEDGCKNPMSDEEVDALVADVRKQRHIEKTHNEVTISESRNIVDELFGIAANLNLRPDEVRDARLAER